jgi:arylsulfatase A
MLSRRALLATSATAALGSLSAAATKRPNIVLIFADDLGYGDLACYGHPTIRTPHLDQLAASGMRFTQYYSANPLCSPSRAALLTGRLHVRSGINVVLFPWSKGGLPKSEITIAEALKPAGYATKCVGKWHLGHLPAYLPTSRGFDSYFGIPYSNDMSASQWPVAYGAPANANQAKSIERYQQLPEIPLLRDDKVIESNPDQAQLTPRYTQEAVSFIRDAARRRQPFFLYFPHTFPHVPLAASAKFKDQSRRGLYGDAVEELDASVGEVMKALRDSGVDKDTLVLFTSDNGPARMENPGRQGTGGSAGLFRDYKGSTWEGGVREPFIARWPGKIAPGQVSHAFAEAMDIFPTVLAAAGVPLPNNRDYDGADLGGVLYRAEKGRPPLHFYYQAGDVVGVRQGPWKLHLVPSRIVKQNGELAIEPPPLLYHLEHDPSERFNAAPNHPGIVQRLQAVIDEHRRSVTRGEPQT